ncbi:hypothetical protein PQQ88_27315 [Paraburkholderia caledonica]|uniref:hypothetical protein n=1 Tax=Paraburkholderia caledonica TaxID=134536 RepID=UPI0038B7D517
MAILEMRRHCITQHPLRSDLEFLDWYKPRAARHQRVEFPKNKQWSAPNIIRRLMRLNANLLCYAKEEDRGKLFLAMVNRKAQVPSSGRLRTLHQLFLEKHSLPGATFSQYRASNAELHRIAGGNLAPSQARLNHLSGQTTLLYVDRQKMKTDSDQLIHHYQGRIVQEAVRSADDLSPSTVDVGYYSETLFGFGCTAPFAGIAPGSRAGHLCENFSHCAQCPGALVPLDNPHVVARLLASFAALERARGRAESEGWMPRFNALYAIPHHVLSVELLPRVTDSTKAKALPLMRETAVPNLE